MKQSITVKWADAINRVDTADAKLGRATRLLIDTFNVKPPLGERGWR